MNNINTTTAASAATITKYNNNYKQIKIVIVW